MRNHCKKTVLRPAPAYIDAGTGALVFQAVAGLLLGGLFALKMYWRRLREALRKLLGRSPGDGDGNGDG